MSDSTRLAALVNNPLFEAFGNCPKWVNWRLEPDENGKLTKVPYNPAGYKAASTHPATWATLAEVQAAAHKFNGIGIVFTDGLLLGVDLDEVLNQAGGIVDDKALRFYEAAQSYTEISPSDHGLHVFLQLNEPLELQRNRSGRYECYTQGRYFTVTGKPYEDAKPIRTVTPLEAVNLLGFLGYPWQAEPSSSNGKRAPDAIPQDDSELIERIRKSAQGAKFDRLWRGDISGYGGDDSAADCALANILAWWTQHDAVRTDRLFRQSGLMRSKWDERHAGDGRTYGEMTIDEALSYVTGEYDPHRAGQKAKMNDAPPDDDKHPHHERDSCDDMGNGYRFADQHRQHVCYVDVWGWMIFDSKRWVRDTTGVVMQLAKDTAASIWDEVSRAGKVDTEAGQKKAKRLASWAATSRSRARLESMLALAQSELPARVEDFDRDPLVLNVQNGTLDLDTMTLKPHDPADMLTRICNAAYKSDAPTPKWTDTLKRFMSDELIAFMQRSLGLAITGQVEKAFWFLYGPTGDNGKSTITATVAHVLGDYADHVGVDVLTGKHRSPGDEDQLASLSGARMVVSSEVDARQMNARLIKDLTGEMDTIRTKFMNEGTFEFRPRFKLFIYGNKQPKLDATDQALWNRVLRIPFEREIAKNEQIKNFSERLKVESDGILAWLVDGFKSYQKDGLNPPREVTDATKAYRDEMDTLGQFISEFCTVAFDAWVKFSEFKELYEKHAGEKAPADLGSRLIARGFKRDKTFRDGRIYRGLGLIPSAKGAPEEKDMNT